jgi:alpha-amylase/alpha-mannosidase (GH57 family)
MWHMHQPYYGDAATGEQLLPWVRLHGLKDYFGMVELLREFPNVRVTFNLVPSLLLQLDALATGRGRDRYFDLAMKPAAELTADDRAFLVANFFHAHRPRMIDPYPRYAQLLIKREEEPGPDGEERWRRAAARFTEHDLRDLQVWQQLAWIDPLYAGDPRVRALLGKGRDFTGADKHVLAEVEHEILRRVIPAYRDAEVRGQIEVSSSPFYHPILPLLCDTEVYAQMHPGARLPEFRHPEDAQAQLARAVTSHEHFFQRRPAGLWPPEGSVSEAMVPLVADAGFQWMATDEVILGRSRGVSFTRDGAGNVEQPEVLYRAYKVRVGGRDVRCLFRDHVISDLIGFTYSSWEPEHAAHDLVNRIVEAGRRFRDRTGGEEATVPVILDGENAWEYFEANGRPFLRAFYRLVAEHPELRTVTMREATADARETLDRLAPGSWAGGDFYIWIGHQDDQKGWSQLAGARRTLGEARDAVAPEAYTEALEHAFVAEGSDWFWWYGDDHSSDQDLEFDILFRSHVRRVYEILGRAVPDHLFVTNITEGVKHLEVVQPTGPLKVTLDGRVTSASEWAQAGYPILRRLFGTMRQVSEGDELRVRNIRFGFDAGNLLVRVELAEPMRQALADGVEFDVAFVEPAGLRVAVTGGRRETVATMLRQEPSGTWAAVDDVKPAVAADEVLEVALPLEALRGGPFDSRSLPQRRSTDRPQSLAFFIAVTRAGVEVTRYPAYAPITTRVPGPQTSAG